MLDDYIPEINSMYKDRKTGRESWRNLPARALSTIWHPTENSEIGEGNCISDESYEWSVRLWSYTSRASIS